MKLISISVLLFSLLMGTTKTDTSFFDFNVTDIHGNEVSLDEFKGKVIMVVNTASECGYTSQYEDLQFVYSELKDKGFVVLGFPANNFGGQEPGTDEQIREFCEVNFNISFPMFSKVEVRGPDQNPLFDYLTNLDNQDFTGAINWNFEKFLIDRDGNLQRRFRSAEKPTDDEIKSAIQQLL